MKDIQYYWERRKVIKRTTKNLMEWAIREPFRSRGKLGEKDIIFVCQNSRALTFNIAYPLKHNEKIRTILFSKVFEYGFQSKAFDEIHFFLNYTDLSKRLNPFQSDTI